MAEDVAYLGNRTVGIAPIYTQQISNSEQTSFLDVHQFAWSDQEKWEVVEHPITTLGVLDTQFQKKYKSFFQYVLIGTELVHIKDLPSHTKNLQERNEFLESKNITKEHEISKHFNLLYIENPYKESWSHEGIKEPTPNCLSRALDTAVGIFNNYSLMPIRIEPSTAEGIMITFFDKDINKSLEIELYNDGDIAGVVNRDNQIISCIDINDESDLQDLIESYKAV